MVADIFTPPPPHPLSPIRKVPTPLKLHENEVSFQVSNLQYSFSDTIASIH